MTNQSEIWGAKEDPDPDVIVVPDDPKKAYGAGLKYGIDHNMKIVREFWEDKAWIVDQMSPQEMHTIQAARKNDSLHFIGFPDRIEVLAAVTRGCMAASK